MLMEKKNRRLLTIDSPDDRLEPLQRQVVRKPIEGGVLVQTEEPPIIDGTKRVRPETAPTGLSTA